MLIIIILQESWLYYYLILITVVAIGNHYKINLHYTFEQVRTTTRRIIVVCHLKRKRRWGQRSSDFSPSGKNHANYINNRGYYDIVEFFQDHSTIFKGLSKVFLELWHRISRLRLIVNRCLATQAGHEQDRAKTFERLVIAKHRLSRIYCCPEKVKFKFLDR